MKKILIFLILLMPILAHSQTVHLILFAATNDDDLKNASQATYNYFNQTFVSQLESAGFTVNPQYYIGNDFTRTNMNTAISNLYTYSNDIIIFYFTGHGENDCTGSVYPEINDYPTLLVGANDARNLPNKLKSEMEVFKTLRNKPHKLLLVIAEACNSVDSPSTTIYVIKDIDMVKFKNLFLSSGDYIVSSSRKGEESWAPKTGNMGCFSRAFKDVFEEQTRKSYPYTPTWNSIFSATATKTTDYAAQMGKTCIQHPQYKVYGSSSGEPAESEKKAYMDITSITFANTRYNGTIIDSYGSTLYTSDMQYLQPKITYNGLASEPQTVTLYCKIIKPDGSIERGSSSPSGYTYSNIYTIYPGTGKTLELLSWGNADKSIYPSGTYYFELYYNGNRIYRQPFTIYKKYEEIEREKASAHKAYMDITSITFANTRYSGTIINPYGSTLYASDMRYLQPKITYNGLAAELKSVTLYCKIIKPDGSIERGTSSPSGYTYSNIYTIYPGTGKTLELLSWGNADKSIYPSGTYYFELYYNGNRIYRQPFTIY